MKCWNDQKMSMKEHNTGGKIGGGVERPALALHRNRNMVLRYNPKQTLIQWFTARRAAASQLPQEAQTYEPPSEVR